MTTITVCRKIDEAELVVALQEVCEKFDAAGQEMVLDFSSVRRLDSVALCSLENLARKAGEKSINLALRGVNLDVYKTLKLVKLTSKFSFVN